MRVSAAEARKRGWVKDEPTQPRGMNAAESRFALGYLDPLKASGEIEDWRFEAMRLKLAARCWFKPDFVAWAPRMRVYEFKGFMREAARVRLLVAAELYPWMDFYLVQDSELGGWTVDPVSATVAAAREVRSAIKSGKREGT